MFIPAKAIIGPAALFFAASLMASICALAIPAPAILAFWKTAVLSISWIIFASSGGAVASIPTERISMPRIFFHFSERIWFRASASSWVWFVI